MFKGTEKQVAYAEKIASTIIEGAKKLISEKNSKAMAEVVSVFEGAKNSEVEVEAGNFIGWAKYVGGCEIVNLPEAEGIVEQYPEEEVEGSIYFEFVALKNAVIATEVETNQEATMKNAVEVLNNLNLTAAELAELIHCNNYLSLVANEEGDCLLCSSKEEEYMEHKNGYEYVGTLKEGACECQYCEEGAEPTFDTPELINEALWVLEEALNETVMA